MRPLSSDQAAILAVARAIGGVIARRAVNEEPAMMRLDGLGRLMAMNQLADRMAPDLREEAKAALEAAEALLHPPETEALQ